MTYDIHAENRVFRELFENSPHALWVFDTKTLAFLAVNHSACAKYGYTRDEFLSMKATDIHPPDEVPRFLKHLGNQDNDVDRAGQWRHRSKDGTLLYVDITAQKIVFSGRNAEMVLAVDMTGQVNALKKLDGGGAALSRTYRAVACRHLHTERYAYRLCEPASGSDVRLHH